MGHKNDSDELTLSGRNIERKDIKEIIAEKRAASEAFRAGYDARRATLEVSRQLARLREEKRVSQRELARLMATTQQAVSRMESPDYEGHSLRMVRKYAEALGVRPVLTFEALDAPLRTRVIKRTMEHLRPVALKDIRLPLSSEAVVKTMRRAKKKIESFGAATPKTNSPRASARSKSTQK